MAATFIDHVVGTPGDWTPFTKVSLGDPAWTNAFRAGDERTRHNLVYAWFSEMVATAQSPVAEMFNHLQWYRLIASYIPGLRDKADLSYQGEAGLFSDEALDSCAFTAAQHALLKTHVEKTIFGTDAERIEALLAIANIALAPDTTGFGSSEWDQLVEKLLWLGARDYPQHRYLHTLAIRATCYNATYSSHPDPVLGEEPKVWYALAQMVIDHRKMTDKYYNAIDPMRFLQKHPPDNLAYHFVDIYQRSRQFNVDSWYASENNPLRGMKNGVPNAYTMLRRLVPEHVTLWNTGDSLELDPLQATLNITLCENGDAIAAPLPQTLQQD